MLRIGIILGSTRTNRRGDQVATWVHKRASERMDAEFELIDLRDHPLPHLDEPLPAMAGNYRNEHTKAWSKTISAFDGYVIITPEYNSFTSAALKNAIDYLFAEWSNKAVGFVSYGVDGGTTATQNLRQICGVLNMADVSAHVKLPIATEFEGYTTFKPSERSATLLGTMLDQVVAWSTALGGLRNSDEIAA